MLSFPYNRNIMKYITVTIARDPKTGLLSVDHTATKQSAGAVERRVARKARSGQMAVKKAAAKKAAAKRA